MRCATVTQTQNQTQTQHQQNPNNQSNSYFKQPIQPNPNVQFNQEKQRQKKIVMNDDDLIQPKKQDGIQEYDLKTDLSFEIKPLNKIQRSSSVNGQYIPAMICLKEDQITANNWKDRVGVDLICLIDISYSMRGEKIEMVKQPLLVLLQFLGASDRLQLIIYNDQPIRLTNLKCTTEENKRYFKDLIKRIVAHGSTCISGATEMAFQQLKQRKYRNNVTSIFLLSDGQDYFAYSEIKSQISQNEQVFTLHTFGFGQDTDAEMMTSISRLANGSFYFVCEISLLDEFFVDALGGLKSVIGEKALIEIENISQPPFQDIQISKTFGTKWEKIEDKFQIRIPQFSCGTRKDYVFEFLLPQINFLIDEDQKYRIVFQAKLTITDTLSQQKIEKREILELVILNENEEFNQNEADIDVYCQYFRVKGAEVIMSAIQLCETNDYDQAQTLIQDMLVQIKNYEEVAASDQYQGIIQDLEQALVASQEQEYFDYGRSQMMQMANNNYQQTGTNSIFNHLRKQMQQQQRAQFQNLYQYQMMKQVQDDKASNKNVPDSQNQNDVFEKYKYKYINIISQKNIQIYYYLFYFHFQYQQMRIQRMQILK